MSTRPADRGVAAKVVAAAVVVVMTAAVVVVCGCGCGCGDGDHGATAGATAAGAGRWVLAPDAACSAGALVVSATTTPVEVATSGAEGGQWECCWRRQES